MAKTVNANPKIIAATRIVFTLNADRLESYRRGDRQSTIDLTDSQKRALFDRLTEVETGAEMGRNRLDRGLLAHE